MKYRSLKVRSELCGDFPRSEYSTFVKKRYLTEEFPSFQCLTSLADSQYNTPRSFLILSSTHLTQYNEVRPIDFVYRALAHANDHETETILQAIWEAYGKLHIILLMTTIWIGQVECLGSTNEYAMPSLQLKDKSRWYL